MNVHGTPVKRVFAEIPGRELRYAAHAKSSRVTRNASSDGGNAGNSGGDGIFRDGLIESNRSVVSISRARRTPVDSVLKSSAPACALDLSELAASWRPNGCSKTINSHVNAMTSVLHVRRRLIWNAQTRETFARLKQFHEFIHKRPFVPPLHHDSNGFTPGHCIALHNDVSN